MEQPVWPLRMQQHMQLLPYVLYAHLLPFFCFSPMLYRRHAGDRAHRLPMVITQEPTQPLAALYGAPGVHVPIPREQQNIALALVIAFSMVVIDIFIEGPSQRTLAKEDHLGQALILHRPDPALRIGIQVRAARWQHERLDLT